MKRSKLFYKRSSKLVWLVLLVALSVALWLDSVYFHSLDSLRVRSWRWFLGLERSLATPTKHARAWFDAMETGHRLNAATKELKEQQLYLEAEATRLATIYEEYNQLNKLLNLTKERSFKHSWSAARLVALPRAQFNERFILDKGSDQHLIKGAMVVVARGVVGKIEQLSATSSVVVPLVSPDSIIPVKILRTGRQGFCAGHGYNKLELVDMPASSDIKPGDQLISSNLGGGWSAGFKVGTVKSVSHDKERLFLKVEVEPAVDILELSVVLVLLGTFK